MWKPLTSRHPSPVHEEGTAHPAEVPGVPAVALFEAQVAAAPDAVAVVCGGECLTYGELDQTANRVGRVLVGAGAVPGLAEAWEAESASEAGVAAEVVA